MPVIKKRLLVWRVVNKTLKFRLTFLRLLILFTLEEIPQGPEEMCLSLEHQNPSKTSEIMGYFDRVDDVTVSLHILYTANQETEGSQRAVRQRGYGLRLLIFKMANNKVDLGQIRSEEIVYSRFIKIPLG